MASELGQLLLSLLADGGAPGRVALHGRLAPGTPAPGTPAEDPDRAAGIRGRFLESARVYYPGVELVADTRISPRTDPYLSDHHIDGLTVLPLAIALEAMAEAASVLAGRPLRQLAGTRMDAPVVLLPGDQETTLRICALRRADAVETVVRCAGSGFQVDHFRALFPLGDVPQAPGEPAALQAPGQPTAPQTRQGLGLTVASAGGLVDGTDLYGPVFFQAGPFRRVAFLPEVTSRSCSALVRGADDRPWFAGPEVSGAAGVDAPLVLGSPGLNDAIMHMLQACVPHRRMLPAGFEMLTVSGAEIRGAVQVRAEREAGPSGGWRVTAVNAAGHTAAALSGLRLRDVGPLEASAPWHPTLLAAALEGWAAEFGLDPELRVTVSCGQPGQERQPRADGVPWLDASTGRGTLAGFQLTARASMPVACYWAPVPAGQAGSRERPVVPRPADAADSRPAQASSRNENHPGPARQAAARADRGTSRPGGGQDACHHRLPRGGGEGGRDPGDAGTVPGRRLGAGRGGHGHGRLHDRGHRRGPRAGRSRAGDLACRDPRCGRQRGQVHRVRCAAPGRRFRLSGPGRFLRRGACRACSHRAGER